MTSPTATTLRPSARPRKLISRSEGRVLAFSAAGFSKEQTAELLGVGPETVKSQRASIMRKLKTRNMTHAVAVGFVRGLLDPDVVERAEQYFDAFEARKHERPAVTAASSNAVRTPAVQAA